MELFFLFSAGIGLSGGVLAFHGAVSKSPAQNMGACAPFECGFVAKMPSRPPMSLQFFLTALIFLIFDMELILLYPALSSSSLSGMKLFNLSLFLAGVTGSTLLEWSQRMLEWVK